MKHPYHVEGWQGSLEDLAIAIASLKYDRVANFLGYLAKEISRQAAADYWRGRPKLSDLLYATSIELMRAQRAVDAVWAVCKPHMTNE